jgi:hypothetical protein
MKIYISGKFEKKEELRKSKLARCINSRYCDWTYSFSLSENCSKI